MSRKEPSLLTPHIPYQMTLADADTNTNTQQTVPDSRLGYMGGLGEANKADSWYDEDSREYVDAYDYEGIDIRLGRLPWLESIDDIAGVIEEQLKQKPKDIEKKELKEDAAKSLFGADFTVYEVFYHTEADGDARFNCDLVFMAPEAMYWFHSGVPEDMTDDDSFKETLDDIISNITIEKWTDDFILGDYEPKG